MRFHTSWDRIWTRRSRACPRATARATRRAIRRSATRSTSSGGTTPTTMPRGSATSREVVARPLVTYALVALTLATFVLVERAGTPQALARAVCDSGLIPGELTGALPPGTRFPMGDGLVCLTDPGRQLGNVLTSMFLHGSWMHLLGNMWFLWLFGNNIEDSMGRARFVVFYLACGVAAALVQVVVNPRSVVPMVGASGAISGLLGSGTAETGGVAFWAHVGGFVTGMALVKL